MNIKNLTTKQRKDIEVDELGKRIVKLYLDIDKLKNIKPLDSIIENINRLKLMGQKIIGITIDYDFYNRYLINDVEKISIIKPKTIMGIDLAITNPKNKLDCDWKIHPERKYWWSPGNSKSKMNELKFIIYLRKQEIKRTIKRIDDEIEFLNNIKYLYEKQIDQPDVLRNELCHRVDKMKQQKELYKLMETLE